ncbi:MAG TPA: hypothetical protein PL182_11585 [Pseudobdellovibrionaceae bacterium]|nr:hypothetical protein [Pseudobdellovibrionaceae bacterium]
MAKKERPSEKEIMREMAPFFLHAIWPILIIVVIWKLFAPTTF